MVLLEHLIQERTVLLFLDMRQDIRDGCGHITRNRVGDLGATPNVRAVDVDLSNLGIARTALRQEVRVGEIRAQ